MALGAAGCGESNSGAPDATASQAEQDAGQGVQGIAAADQAAYVTLAGIVGKLRAEASVVVVGKPAGRGAITVRPADVKQLAALRPEDGDLKAVQARLAKALRSLPAAGQALGPGQAHELLHLTTALRDRLATYTEANPEIAGLVPD